MPSYTIASLSGKSSAAQWLSHTNEFLWLSTLFLLPLLFSPGTENGFEFTKVLFFRVMVNAMLLVWITKLFFEKNALPHLRSGFSIFKKYRLLMLFLAAFFVIYVLATLFSVDPKVSFFGSSSRFQGLFTYSCYLLFGVMLVLNLNEEKQLQRLVSTLFIGAAVVSFLAIAQNVNPHVLPFWEDSAFRGRVYGTMGNPNFLATYLAMLVPLMVARLLQKKNSKSAFVGLILSLTALCFTFSRGAYLGLAIGMIFLVVIFVHSTRLPLPTKKWWWNCIALLFVTIGLILMVTVLRSNSPFPYEAFSERMLLKGESFQSIQTRLEIWSATVRHIVARPVLGYGPDTFAMTFPNGATADRAHNEILDMAVQIGIPGMVAYLGFLVIMFFESLKKVFRADDGRDWINQIGLLSGLVVLFTSNQFEFSLTVTWVYFFVFNALLMRFLFISSSS